MNDLDISSSRANPSVVSQAGLSRLKRPLKSRTQSISIERSKKRSSSTRMRASPSSSSMRSSVGMMLRQENHARAASLNESDCLTDLRDDDRANHNSAVHTSVID